MAEVRQAVLKDQVAVVTGSSSGIGAGIARALGLAGSSVLVNYAGHPEGAEKVVHEIILAGGNATPFKADVSQEDQVKEMIRTAVDEFGNLDILVNNAGVQDDSDFLDMTLAQWNRGSWASTSPAPSCAPGRRPGSLSATALSLNPAIGRRAASGMVPAAFWAAPG